MSTLESEAPRVLKCSIWINLYRSFIPTTNLSFLGVTPFNPGLSIPTCQPGCRALLLDEILNRKWDCPKICTPWISIDESHLECFFSHWAIHGEYFDHSNGPGMARRGPTGACGESDAEILEEALHDRPGTWRFLGCPRGRLRKVGYLKNQDLDLSLYIYWLHQISSYFIYDIWQMYITCNTCI